MPVLTLGQRVIFFAHIPKTGGSSVEAYLGQKGELSLFGEPKIDGVHLQHLTRDKVSALSAMPAFDHGFAVVRAPVSRMVSEFIWRSDPLKPLQRLARPLTGATVRGKKRSLTFAEWVPLVLDEARDAPDMRDNHMRPQIDFLARGDRLFLFEQGFEPVFRWIDSLTDGKPGAPVERLKASISAKPLADDPTRALIEEFYSQDEALHREMQAGRSTY